MKKHLLIAMLMPGLSAVAATLSPEAALQRLNSTESTMARMPATNRAKLAFTEYTSGVPTIYVFNRGENGGYMAVSADDAATPLLGYCDAGTLADNGANLPDGLRYWLRSLGEQVAFNSRHGLTPRTTNPTDREDISPMVETRWNQDAPFNNDCPKIGTQTCYTGCVATAMAQVMKYYEYPAKGTGSHYYTWRYTESGSSHSKTLSLDYSTITYDWANMLDRYTSSATDAEKAAVATLMYSCGVSVDMIYGTSGSGAISFNMLRAFIENFGYDKGVRYLIRDYYTIDEWENIIYENLMNYGPVLYGGQSNDGGHQFVCDGYQGGYFHFNWGWGGLSDGYFLLTALDPGAQGIGGSTSGYNFSQDILTHLSPDQQSTKAYEQVLWDGNFTINQSSATLGDKITYTGNFFNYSYGAIGSSSLGVQIIPADGGSPIFISSGSIDGLSSGGGWHVTWGATLPTDLAAGTYTVAPAMINSDGVVEAVRTPINNTGSYVMTVDGDTATFTANTPATIAAEDFTLDSELYIGSPFKVTATIYNQSNDEEFYGTVYVGIERNDTVYAQGGNMQLDLQPGEDLDFEYVATLTKRSNISSLTPGTYDLYLYRENGSKDEKIAGPISVELNAASTPTIKVSGFTIANNQRASDMRAKGTLECTAGYFAGSLSLIIFPGTGGAEIASYQSEFISVEADTSDDSSSSAVSDTGNTANLLFSFDFEAGEPGKEYIAGVYNSSRSISDYVRFTTADTTGIDSVADDNPVTSREYFTPSGLLLGNVKPTTGIYIVRATHADGTVSTYKSAK